VAEETATEELAAPVDGLRQPILDSIAGGVPFLGICIGLQGLFEGSEESPGSRGFGLFPGTVRRFQGPGRVPHMGWDSLDRVKESRLLAGLADKPFTYFAHSYYAPVVSQAAAFCNYLTDYTAVIEDKNIFAVQFHPEKSGPAGLRVMQNFVDL
jgi:imidazole glycerol phosphate synthase glutamine amidotransferase subunit